jgi:choline dehydrogenase-like flavoprotein
MLAGHCSRGVVRPQSRGHICLTGPDPCDPVQIQANMLSHPDDLKAAIASVELCREIGNSAPRNDGKHHGPCVIIGERVADILQALHAR